MNDAIGVACRNAWTNYLRQAERQVLRYPAGSRISDREDAYQAFEKSIRNGIEMAGYSQAEYQSLEGIECDSKKASKFARIALLIYIALIVTATILFTLWVNR